MIIGMPWEFAVFFEVYERHEADNQWIFGPFNFFIKDKLYPAEGSNYTLPMTLGYLADSIEEIINCLPVDFQGVDDFNLIRMVGHSHAESFQDDPDDIFENFNWQNNLKIGVELTPLEVSDTGFRLYFYLDKNNKDSEYLIFTPNYGIDVQSIAYPKGTILNVLKSLPDRYQL